MIVLDTHVLLWMAGDDRRLGERALQRIRRAWRDGHAAASAISFLEIGMLRAKGRVRLSVEPAVLRTALLRDGIVEIPVDGVIGLRAAELLNFPADPADRMIAATALIGGHPLVTADRRILDWAGPLQRIAATD